MKLDLRNSKKGFTLIELLLVIGIIAVLAVVVFVALNPAQRFLDARNSRRTNDVQTILSAIHQYYVDEKGAALTGMPAGDDLGTYAMIGNEVAGSCDVDCGGVTTEANCADLDTSLASYLKSIPLDPSGNRDTDLTGYAVDVTSNGVVTIKACDAEGGVAIEASR